MTSAAARGRGAGRAMYQYSLDDALQRGYRGMQFNFLVSTNTRAVALWESPGFQIVAVCRKRFTIYDDDRIFGPDEYATR